VKTDIFFKDPLGVRKSAEFVLKNSRFVSINRRKIKPFALKIKEKINKNLLANEWQFGRFGKTPQHIFMLDSVNFCFWGKKNEDKWRIEYPKGRILDGWEALVACFDRAFEEKINLDNCDVVKSLDLRDLKHTFRDCNGIEIPLLEERFKFLKESARVLRQKFKGDVYNLIKESDFDAIRISKKIIENFPSFEDVSSFESKKIKFYKRAQIFPYDVSLLKNIKIKNIESLTVFADYKLPQILMDFGITVYKKELAEKVDNYEVLPRGSNFEIEIRAATIVACDLIAQEINVIPVICENAIWSMSQTWEKKHPYHRVLTTNY
jgi:hypothetical protein